MSALASFSASRAASRPSSLPLPQLALPLPSPAPLPVGLNDNPQTGYSPLRVIADERFCAWKGASGRRYVASIYRFGDCPDYENVVALAVRHEADGTRMIIDGLDLGPFPLVALGGDIMQRAQAAGANEIHLHLLADTGTARQAALDDLL